MEKFDKDIDLLANSGRAKGVADFAVNFEPGGQAPLDARLLVPTKADLIKPETYVAKNYYKGMAVTIEADGTEYILMDISKITSPDYSGWKQRDSMSTSSSLPSTIITDLTNVTTNSTTATIHSSKVTKSGRDYGSASDDSIVIPSATTSAAGVMTSAQVTTLNTVNSRNLFGIVKGDTGTSTAEIAIDTLTIAGGTDLETVATDTSENDTLTVNHSSVTRTNTPDSAATYTLPASGGSIALPKVVKSVSSSATGHITATSSETPSIIHGALTTAANTGAAQTPGFGGKVNVVTSATNDGHGHITGITTTSVTIPSNVASTAANGLMSVADKTKLDTTLPNQITAETNRATEKENQLQSSIDSNKSTIDSYTVGGIKISANPKVENGTNTTVSTSNNTITWSLNSTISLTRVNASSGFYQTSDERLKSEIKPLEHSLDDICSIPTNSFILNGKKDLGTIAQSMENKFPELVTSAELKQSDVPNPEKFETIEKDGETYVLVKEVDYAKMSVLAIEGIKLLREEIDELKKQLLDK